MHPRLRVAAALTRRSIWTSSTTISTSPHALVQHYLSTRTASAAPSATTVYTISKNVSSELVALVQETISSPAIGCLSEVLAPSTLSHPRNSPRGVPGAAQKELYSIAVARWTPSDAGERAVAFHSTLQGRPNISLGREIKQNEEVGDESGFENFLAGRSWGFGDAEGAENGKVEVIEELSNVPASNVKELVSFTTERSQPFLSTISSYSTSSNLGLVSSSSPFHSPSHAAFSLFFHPVGGAPYTATTGSLGVAVVSPTSPSSPLGIEYVDFETLGKPLEITSSKGNIVLTLASQNAARILLTEVQNLAASSTNSLQEQKDAHFYAAVFDSPPPISGEVDLSQARIVATIMAGDPSRGAISVETEKEIKVGEWLVFLHRPKAASSPSMTHFLKSSPLPKFTFICREASYTAPLEGRQHENDADAEVIVLDGFVAASENGVVLSRKGKESWIGKEEGVVVALL